MGMLAKLYCSFITIFEVFKMSALQQMFVNETN